MTGGLRVEFEAQAKISATVDVTAYFLGMSQGQQAEYLKWHDRNFWDGDPVQKPVAYVMAGLDESADVACGGMVSGRGVIVDDSEIEEWDTPRLRDGGRWSEGNYAALVAAVPWLAEAARVDEMPDEERAEIEARMPGPLDVPLFPEPERKTE